MKKKQREKSKERIRIVPKFKVLDAVIILLVITSVVGLCLGYNVIDTLKNQKEMQEYVVDFSIENIRYSTTTYVDVGNIIRDAKDGEELGKLLSYADTSSDVALLPEPAFVYFPDSEGNLKQVYYPHNQNDSSPFDQSDRVNATGRFSCMGRYANEDGSLLVNGSKYLVSGQTIEVQTERVTLTLTIKNISLKEVSE